MSAWSSRYLPEPVEAVRLCCLKQLPRLLDKLFENADDALFELADGAVNSAEQTLYFDAMREVRVKREEIENIFLDHIRSGFSHMATDPDAGDETDVADVDSLSLLQQEAVEEEVTIRSMVTTAANRYAEPLDHLTRRLNDLLSERELTIQQNPVGVHALCGAFAQACKELALVIKVRLVLYQLFDQHVLGYLDAFYLSANRVLIQAGILPKIRPARAPGISKNPSVKKMSGTDRQRTDAQHGSGDDLFEMLRDLLAVKQGRASRETDPRAADPKNTVLTQKDLLAILSKLQASGATGAGPLDFESIVSKQLSASKGKAGTRTVAGLDKDIINLVSMLFEFILEDDRLLPPMKVLLARLQIPVLKVTLLDNTFFSQANHPVRRLLNELAQAALGWSGEGERENDPLFRKISDITDTVVRGFEDDPQIFQPLLKEFAAFAQAERRRAALIEKHTREAEEGLGKTQQVRSQVSEIINARAVGKDLPQVVLQLIQEGWSNYLFYLLVREGKDSNAWNEAVKILDLLIWSVQPRSGAQERKRLLQEIPGLLAALREGLATISFNTRRMREIFQGLELCHKQRLHPAGASGASIKMVDRATVIDPPQGEPENIELDEHYLVLADQMRSGAWVEFVNEDGAVSRAKLAAIIKSTGKYIFVNRAGVKIAEKSRVSLAVALREKKIRVLEGGLLFDAALESVIGQLRKDKED